MCVCVCVKRCQSGVALVSCQPYCSGFYAHSPCLAISCFRFVKLVMLYWKKKMTSGTFFISRILCDKLEIEELHSYRVSPPKECRLFFHEFPSGSKFQILLYPSGTLEREVRAGFVARKVTSNEVASEAGHVGRSSLP